MSSDKDAAKLAAMADQVNGAPLNVGTRTALEMMNTVRRNLGVFWLLYVHNGGLLKGDGAAAPGQTRIWEEKSFMTFPPGIGTDVIVGCFYAADTIFALGNEMRISPMMAVTFEMTGQCIVALVRRGFFEHSFTQAELEECMADALKIVGQFEDHKKHLAQHFMERKEEAPDGGQ